MNRLIIVCGLPGAGKTTLAKELSKRLDIVCIHKDEIKECLFEIRNGNSLEDSKAVGKETMTLLFRLTEGIVKNGADLIIEAPFNFPEDYPKFSEWREKYGTEIYAVVCSVGFEERKRRFETRERHRSHFDQDRSVFGKHFDGTEYDYCDIPGTHIRVVCDKSTRALTDHIVSRIME